MNGILLLPGFGSRCSEGKVLSCKYARENKVPFLGICLGLQCAVIELARNVVGLADAHSTEFAKDTSAPVICLLDDQKQIVDKGGTMRLGAQPATLKTNTQSAQCYRADEIWERHRHRYEFNNAFRQRFEAHGLRCTGTSQDDSLVEIVEIENHPWYVAVQFHPEFKSQPTHAHPLFAGFVQAAVDRHSHPAKSLVPDS